MGRENYMIDIPHLLESKKLIFDPCNFKYTDPVPELESREYGACEFTLNANKNKFFVKFRTAKITPTKVGQFVVIWKRIGRGPIQPFDQSDQIDFVIVCVNDKNYLGQFIFPQSKLVKQNIFSKNNNGGKRAIRVYPPWVKTESTQAKKTQTWQLEFFLDLSNVKKIDLDRAKKLLSV